MKSSIGYPHVIKETVTLEPGDFLRDQTEPLQFEIVLDMNRLRPFLARAHASKTGLATALYGALTLRKIGPL